MTGLPPASVIAEMRPSKWIVTLAQPGRDPVDVFTTDPIVAREDALLKALEITRQPLNQLSVRREGTK